MKKFLAVLFLVIASPLFLTGLVAGIVAVPVMGGYWYAHDILCAFRDWATD